MTSSRRSTDPDWDDAGLFARVQLSLLASLRSERLVSLLTGHDPKSLVENASPALLGERACRELESERLRERTLRALAMLERDGVTVTTLHDEAYPPVLRLLGALAPPVLFLRGRTELISGRCLAIIGARDSTEYGDSVAELFATELAGMGITIVSGLARGIDGVAHASALRAGGGTIAVMGSGIDVPYPPSHARLHARIAEAGLLISEYAPGMPAFPRNFPQRNRLIALLSKGVLVVEAGVKSGTRNTVEWALAYNREVMAVPGPIGRSESAGTNQIIRDGGHIVVCSRDVLEILRWSGPAVADAAGADRDVAMLDGAQRAVYRAVAATATHVDEIARRSGLQAPQTLTCLMQLELAGLVAPHPGMRFARVLLKRKAGATGSTPAG